MRSERQGGWQMGRTAASAGAGSGVGRPAAGRSAQRRTSRRRVESTPALLSPRPLPCCCLGDPPAVSMPPPPIHATGLAGLALLEPLLHLRPRLGQHRTVARPTLDGVRLLPAAALAHTLAGQARQDLLRR